MEPVGLGGALHHEQAAAFQQDGNLFIETLVLEPEPALRAETDGGDGGVPAERALVVAVPGHALAAVLIEIEQAGVEGGGGQTFDDRFERGEFRGPEERLFGGAGVGVGKAGVAVPRDLSGSDDVFAEDDGFIMFPRNVVEKCFVISPGVGGAENGAVIVHHAVAWQQVEGWIVAEKVHGGAEVVLTTEEGHGEGWDRWNVRARCVCGRHAGKFFVYQCGFLPFLELQSTLRPC